MAGREGNEKYGRSQTIPELLLNPRAASHSFITSMKKSAGLLCGSQTKPLSKKWKRNHERRYMLSKYNVLADYTNHA